jgi:hypothetical protein
MSTRTFNILIAIIGALSVLVFVLGDLNII